MRKVTYGAACSVDGFITGPDGAIDWIHSGKDVEAIMAAYWANVDTILMGRKTYEMAVAMMPQADSESWSEGFAGVTTYVFSHTLSSLAGPRTALVRTDAGEFVRALKQKPGKDICMMGGGELARSLFAAGVIDEVGLNIHPVLLGSGVPFFRDAGRIELELIESKVLEGGCVLANYRVRQ